MYTTIFVIGMAATVWWFTFPHTTVVGEVDQATVAWTAERGTGYTYRWDFDSDGVVDTEWSESPAGTHEYGAEDAYVGLVAQIEDSDGTTAVELPITPAAQPIPLEAAGYSIEQLAPADTGPTPAVPPTVRMEQSRVVLDTGTATANVGSETATREDHEFDMDAGDVARISGTTVRIGARVCATVETRSAFGNLSHTRECMTVRVPHTEMAPMASAGVLR